jgi:hypothetical protein
VQERWKTDTGGMHAAKQILRGAFYALALACTTAAPIIALTVSGWFGIGNTVIDAYAMALYVFCFLYFAAPSVLVVINFGLSHSLRLDRVSRALLWAAVAEAVVLTLSRYSGSGGEGAPYTAPKSILTMLAGESLGYASGLIQLVTLAVWATTAGLLIISASSCLPASRDLGRRRSIPTNP